MYISSMDISSYLYMMGCRIHMGCHGRQRRLRIKDMMPIERYPNDVPRRLLLWYCYMYIEHRWNGSTHNHHSRPRGFQDWCLILRATLRFCVGVVQGSLPRRRSMHHPSPYVHPPGSSLRPRRTQSFEKSTFEELAFSVAD